MSDFGTIPVDAPVDVPAPVAPPSDNSDQREEIINRNRETALSQLAKKENIEDYAQERVDQAMVIDQGEELPEEQQNRWYRRASKALQDAALEAQGVKLDEHGQPEFRRRLTAIFPLIRLSGCLPRSGRPLKRG